LAGAAFFSARNKPLLSWQVVSIPHFKDRSMRIGLVISTALAAAFPLQQAQAQIMPLPGPFAFDSTPGRLPKNVVPISYAIALTPDTAAMKIAGSEKVVLDFKQASATIQFNSLNQVLSNVRLDGKPVKGVVSDDKAQLSTVTLAAPAKAGRHTLTFDYVGRIETEPHGLFLQPFTKPGGGKGQLLSTQFEATDARRMFPCWDEPAFRATYQLTVTTPSASVNYSNMPVAKRSVHGALATTEFGRSPKMASYLVEFTSGDLAQISGTAAGTTINVVAVKGQEQGGATALANAQQILADYNDYFGVRFPLPKLDAIAVPGGFSGAMENWGAITYNDQALLVTPSSTMGNRQTVFSIQAHEMAHQWFGDLVTMGWWDELWLNESFASWMAAHETDARNPSWRWWEGQDGSKEEAMGADAHPTSHAILQHVTNEQEATSAFDPRITYSKGQAVLRMLEAHLGPDAFRAGIRRYMATHAYSNTTSADLWASLSAASGRDVGAIAAAWTSQAGFPLVSVQAACDGAGQRTVALSQRRFMLDGKDPDQARWNVPLRVRVGTGAAQAVLLPRDGLTIPAGRCDEALSVNADAVGYYRADYDDATLAVNTARFGKMADGDRIALLDDQWALVEAGARPLSSYLALAAAMGTDLNQRAWEQITGALDSIERDERGTPGHDAFMVYARTVIKPLLAQLGWDAKADETPGIQRLRRTVIADLGAWGDADVVAEARKRFAAFITDRASVRPDDQAMLLGIVGQNASAADFAQLHAIAKDARNQTELQRYYTAMMRVRDPALASQAIAIALSDEIPQQAATARLSMVLTVYNAHPALAWSTFQQNVDPLMAPFQPNGPFILAQYVPEIFWNTVPLEELEPWVRQHVPAEVLPNLARGMETARFNLAEKTMLVKAADAYVSGQTRRQ
jgi:aminopeptidase N